METTMEVRRRRRRAMSRSLLHQHWRCGQKRKTGSWQGIWQRGADGEDLMAASIDSDFKPWVGLMWEKKNKKRGKEWATLIVLLLLLLLLPPHDFSLALQQRKRGEEAGWLLVSCVGQAAKLCSVALCCGFDYNKITGDGHGSRPMIMSRWTIYHHHDTSAIGLFLPTPNPMTNSLRCVTRKSKNER